MAYKRLDESTFALPAIRDGAMTLNRAQFEALFARLWQRDLRPGKPACQGMAAAYDTATSSARSLDLSAIPEDQHEIVLAVLREGATAVAERN